MLTFCRCPCEAARSSSQTAGVGAGGGRHRRRRRAGRGARAPARRPRRGGQPVRARHVALGLAAGPASTIASATLSGVETIQRVAPLDQLALGEALGATKPGSTRPTWTPCGALLEVQRVGPAGERELARRVGAGVPARHPPGGARDVDDRARRATRAAAAAAPRSAAPRRRSSAPCGGGRCPSRLAEAPPPRGAGVVDEQVQARRARSRPPRATARRRVLLDEVDRYYARAAELVGELAEALLAPGDEHEPPAGLARDVPRRGLADPARGAGDERDQVVAPSARRSTSCAPSRAIRERGTTRSKPAPRARSGTSTSTCE